MNKQDGAYACLWAKYLISNDYKRVMKSLNKLARTGQIDAIQKWYMFNNVGVDRLVDVNLRIVDKSLPQYYLILANIEKNKNKDLYTQLTCEIQKTIDETNAITMLQCIVKKDGIEKFESNCDKLELLKNDIKTTKYYQYLFKAKYMALTQYKKTGDLTKLSLYIDILEQMYNLTLDAQIKTTINKNTKLLIYKIQQELPVVDCKEKYLFYEYLLGKSILRSGKQSKREEATKLLLNVANASETVIDNTPHQLQ